MFEPFYENDLEDLKIEIDISDKPLSGISDAAHLENVKRLCTFYADLKAGQEQCAATWRPGGEWDNYNKDKAFFYTTLLLSDYEKAEGYYKEFWRNKLGLIVKEYAKFEDVQAGPSDTVSAFKRSIGRNFLIWKELYNQPTEVLSLSNFVGNPWGCTIDGEFITPKAFRFHSNASQIKNLVSHIPQPVVAEIGGGYGGLAYYLSKEITNLTYINFDLPETLVLMAYYLLHCCPDKKTYLYSKEDFSSQNLDEYDFVLLPNYAIEEVKDKYVDVFFNSFSLSEMPPETNAAYIDQIHRLTKKHFLHNNMDRAGVINRGHERIPASLFPMDPNKFISLVKNFDSFHSHFGDYKEFLYEIR